MIDYTSIFAFEISPNIASTIVERYSLQNSADITIDAVYDLAMNKEDTPSFRGTVALEVHKLSIHQIYNLVKNSTDYWRERYAIGTLFTHRQIMELARLCEPSSRARIAAHARNQLSAASRMELVADCDSWEREHVAVHAPNLSARQRAMLRDDEINNNETEDWIDKFYEEERLKFDTYIKHEKQRAKGILKKYIKAHIEKLKDDDQK